MRTVSEILRKCLFFRRNVINIVSKNDTRYPKFRVVFIKRIAKIDFRAAHRFANLVNLVDHIEGTYESLEQEKIKYTDQSSQLVDNILHEVENAFYRLGLTEGQERELLKIINNAVDKSLSHYEEDIKLDHQLKSIAAQLLSLSTMH